MRAEFERVMRERGLQFDSTEYDEIAETAISFIVAAGYQSEDEDLMGDEVSGNIQSHLMLAMLRSPALEEVMFAAINEYIAAAAKLEDERRSNEALAVLRSMQPQPQHRGEPQHTCQLQHPDDPRPCPECMESDPMMLVCCQCGEAFDSMVTASRHVNEDNEVDDAGFYLPCDEGYNIVPQSEAM